MFPSWYYETHSKEITVYIFHELDSDHVNLEISILKLSIDHTFLGLELGLGTLFE